MTDKPTDKSTDGQSGVSQENLFLERVYAATDKDELQAIYDEWASTYNTDMVALDYTAPNVVVDKAIELIGEPGIPSAKFLDAGCGTGLGGLALSKLGARHVDGVDYSPGMIDIARRTGIYRRLERVDLADRVPVLGDRTYDAVVCSGTLTMGHVGPVPVLEEFARIAKAGGFVVATVHDKVWKEAGYQAEVDRLAAGGKVELLGSGLVEYRKGQGAGGRLLVLKVL